MRFQFLVVNSFLLVSSVFQVHGQPFNDIVVFGDSHSDIGNLCSIFPDPDCVGLRYSNGPVWVEVLASQLDIPTPRPSLDGGLNFAFGGARTGKGNDSLFGVTIPRIGGQISRFLDNGTPKNDQLFVVFAGHNDWNWDASVNPSVPAVNMSSHITTLAEAGAEHFLIPNLSPLGHAPFLRGTTEGLTIDQAIDGYNDLLGAQLSTLEQQLGIDIHRVDLASLTKSTIEDPMSMGLSNVLDRADGRGVTNPNEYLYWDYIHFTSAFHQKFGQQAALAVVPESSSFALCFLALVVFALLSARRLHVVRQIPKVPDVPF